MKIFTIGFTKKSAEVFFTHLQNFAVRRLIDVRLNNVSQLVGFTKRDDLRYFVSVINKIDYLHAPTLAPTAEMLDAYKKLKGDWGVYERQFLELMEQRHIEDSTPRATMDGACLLCSAEKPDRCHRRLVAEYLRGRWGDVEIEHIL